MMGAVWSPLESIIAKFMFINFLIDKLIPSYIRKYFERYSQKLVNSLNPYIQVYFDEFKGEHLRSNQAFSAIRHYLREESCAKAKKLNADVVTGSKSPILSMDSNQEVTDEFQGVKVWWRARKVVAATQNRGFNSYPPAEVRSYCLTFHSRDRELIIENYINHVVEGGKAIQARNRKKKLYSNNPIDGRHSGNKWSHVTFQHPATFDTLAMEMTKKEDIKNDLLKFVKGKEYYAKIGKAWKRGYLLYGPPGTGKSTMIAAMANLLNYDVYDLELTAVKDNTELKRLLIETSNKSIIVIEDIDCSIDLTGQRDKKKRKDEHEKKKEDSVSVPEIAKEEGTKLSSNVTLSGLLNFIDGLWSACGEERVIVFTTNYVNKLDPALIRRGRMDKHIEMSYCCFEAFKFLAKNYLEVESHELFEEIGGLLKEVSISPADVAENLMPKSDMDDADVSLKNLIQVLNGLKEQARKKAKEEARTKEEKEEKEKKEKEKEEARLKAEKEAKEKEEAHLKEEKQKEERLKAEKEEKEEEEARQKAEKEGKGNEDAGLKAESVERKAKNSLLKKMLKKMKNPRKK